MSEGARLDLGEALGAAECIARMWGITGDDALLVGSARRRRPTVGDIEFTCRRPAPGERDVLFDAMDPTMETGGLFGAGTVPIARPLKGFKRGFGYCDCLVEVTNEITRQAVRVRVQIHRWDPDGFNRGWIELMRTGPSGFGIHFLAAWKKRWGIPPSAKASVDGMLFNAAGNQVKVATESEAFIKCGMSWVAPEQRDVFIAQVDAARGRDQAYARR